MCLLELLHDLIIILSQKVKQIFYQDNLKNKVWYFHDFREH